jgi:Putative peptidoglycan binding domain
MLPYVVRQGDYLSKLAHRFAFDADAVWNHSSNESLRSIRDNPEVLAPGDVLFIPDRAQEKKCVITNGTTNRYAAKVPTTAVILKLRDPAGNAIAGKAYRVTGVGTPITGSSDDRGVVSFRVPLHVWEVVVVLEDGGSVRVLVGHMDPPQTASGALKRLRHLGYRAPASFEPEDALRLMVTRFQREQKLTVSGNIDEQTASALVRVHGS